MKKLILNKLTRGLTFLLLFSLSQITLAEDTHKLVIQISSNDLIAQKTALSNIVNIQKHYGMDNVEIELVAFGPGYRMLTPQSPLASRISSLALQDVTFTACMTTLLSIKEQTGIMPKLVEGVTTTQAGVPHIMELQEKGYSYIKY